MKSRQLIFLTVLFLGSCATSNYVFNTDQFQNIGLLTVNSVIRVDLDNGSKDITPNHLIGIGRDIYPNEKRYVLATPKTSVRQDKNFKLETEFYYTPSDSLVRVILYQWGKVSSGDQKNEFQKQFNKLRQSLNKNLGDPSEIDIQQKEFNPETYRDGIKWTGKGKVNAYLFMFGNDRTKYRQIRLAIYRE